MRLKLFLTLSILVFSTSLAFAQKNAAQQADAAFENRRYREAVDLYEKAFSKVKSNRAEKNRITYQIAECYRLTGDYSKAVNYYKKLEKAKYQRIEPRLFLYMADSYRFMNEIDKAKLYYAEFLKLEPNDEAGLVGKKSLGNFQEFVANKTRHKIVEMERFNGKQNEWAPIFLGEDTNTVLFTSSRESATGENRDAWTGEDFSDIFYTIKDSRGNWTSPEPFDAKINSEGHEGEPTFSLDKNTIYFTRCESRPNESLGCFIMTSSRATPKKRASKKQQEEAGAWSDPVKLVLGDSLFSFVHPAISSDGLTLYFASDLQGGEGEMDLWKATRASISEPFGAPESLGKEINTKSKELFPVLVNDTVLYFSSNGHVGLGGLDLYKSVLRKGKWSKAENLGYPMNSIYDEIGIALYPQSEGPLLERGYFSSNRPEAYPHEKNGSKKRGEINDNIYYFELPPLSFTLAGVIRNEKSMQLVPGAKVKIMGTDGSINETTTNKKGAYSFSDSIIQPDVTYKMYISKIDFFSTVTSVSTKGYRNNVDLVQDVRLDPVPTEPVVLPEILYDVAKWDLKEQYQDSLFDLLTVLRNNPSFVIEIRSHTDCRPFYPLTNDTLSQRRAQSVVDYLISRRIEPGRLVAKGYGDRVPREMDHTTTITQHGKNYTFKKGTKLTCDYIKSLPKEEQEIAHQLNRRTEFAVLRTDYKIKKENEELPFEEGDKEQVINLVKEDKKPDVPAPTIIVGGENKIPVMMIHSTKGEVDGIVNGSLQRILIDEKYRDAVAFSWTEAMRFLYDKRITKEDFPERDNAFDPEGNIIENSIIVLKSLQIGPRKIENVEAVVIKGLSHNIIMNRFGLKAFGDYEFDKQKGILIFK